VSNPFASDDLVDLMELVRRYFRAKHLAEVEMHLLIVANIGAGSSPAMQAAREIEQQLMEAVGHQSNPYWTPIQDRMWEFHAGHNERSEYGQKMGYPWVAHHHPANYFEWRDTGEAWVENETESA
jgi:hypothetical protein